MCILYLIMLISAGGIMLGWNYKLSCVTFALPYWYMFLLDKSSWNNHSYMFGLLVLLFLATDSHSLWSVDAYKGVIPNNRHVPLWNYAVLRFQLFLLYFYAGLKKTEFDWINGYSMASLSDHWVFFPMKVFLDKDQIDLWIIHVFGFLIDLTMGFLIYFDKTRALSFYILTSFHLMNSQMFHIGMFPFVCLATMPLFCGFNWPRQFFLMQMNRFKFLVENDTAKNPICYYEEDVKDGPYVPKKRQCVTVVMLYMHAVIQLFLPYSHFVTLGYNNWTNGLYGYSWDMMVHTWDTSRIAVKLVNFDTNESMFIDPEAWVQNNRWQRHADMIYQYSKCVKKNVKALKKMNNMALYIDIWVSLNKRFHQRMFDPRVDILSVKWSPFERVSWVMPLLDELTPIRDELRVIEKKILSSSNHSDVLFMADFPGFTLENYVHEDLENITLQLIKGKVSVSIENKSTILAEGGIMKVPSATFHNVSTISESPSAFMYVFYNKTKHNYEDKSTQTPLTEIISAKIDNFINAIALLSRAVLRILHSTPMIRRIKIEESDTLYV
ncbi:unnamed protein product [Nezara viridula]|uniref:Vitamin K-dependent gamma-carboxylase n=1 Tax=Nezara viridula TaxID=85310 RepID=A0A9P0EAP8_NEZVI|nr:unnamed protein product [Nezara viridula]